MQSPVHAYLKRPSMVDFPGRMAAVFFTSGCNFRCGYCHNAVALGSRRPGLIWEALGEACDRFAEQWVKAVVVTGGEPTLWKELPRLIDFFKERGFAVKLDTNGSDPEMLEKLLPRLDYVAMDIKCGLSTYAELVQYHRPEVIARSVALIIGGGIDYEFRTTLLESVHDEEEMAAIAELIQGASRYVLQPFLPRDDLPDVALRSTPRTSSGHLRWAAGRIRSVVDELIVRGE